MRADLDAVRAALDAGLSLGEVERTVVGTVNRSEDQRAALWLYACAYDALRPRAEDLAERLTRRPTLRGQRVQFAGYKLA